MDVPQVSTEDLLAQAQSNASAFFIITVAYLKDRGLDVEDWTTYLGERFASTWSSDMGAREVAEAFALNIMSNGGNILGINGDDQQAELHCDWPPENMLWPGVTIADTDHIAELTRTIVTQIGMQCDWQRHDTIVVLKISK